jgi:hypothetical protein
MKPLVIFIGLLFTGIHVFAQQGEGLLFEEDKFDFGDIKEVDGPVQHEFSFVNVSKEEVTIKSVRASCGCTTPAWTKEPVAPGDTGFIKAKYNPRNRPGPFNKSLTITTTASESPYRLYIKGKVEPRPRTPEEDYPLQLGSLRAKSKVLNFGRMKVNLDGNTVMSMKREKGFELYNSSDQPIALTGEMEGPEHIQLVSEDLTIPPKKSGKFLLSYDTQGFEELGYRSENIVIYTTDTLEPKKEFYTATTLVEYFPAMTAEEKANAPRLTFDTRYQDLGKIKQGEKVSAEYVITNAGKTPLNIRQITPNCDCITLQLESNDIPPGESQTLKVEMDAQNRTGIQQKAITIYSNDPVNPTQMISIRTRVEG